MLVPQRDQWSFHGRRRRRQGYVGSRVRWLARHDARGLPLFFRQRAQQRGLQLLQPRLVGIRPQPLRHHRRRAVDVAIGLHPARLCQAPRDEIFALAIRDPARQALRRSMVRLQMQHLLHDGVGRFPVRIHQPPRLLQQRVHQHRANHRIARIQVVRLAQGRQRFFRRSLFARIPRLRQPNERLAAALLALAHQLFQLQQFGLAGKFRQRARHRLQGALIVAAFQIFVGLLHPPGLGIFVRLLIAPLDQPLNLERQPRLLIVDRFQDLPLIQRVVELPALFEEARFGHDGIHQVPLVPHQPDRTLEVRFAGVQLERIFQYAHPPVQVRFRVHPPVGLRDHLRQPLPLPLFHVELERLKQRVVGIFRQILPAHRHGSFKIVGRQIALGFLVGILERVVLRVDLVVEILIRAAAPGVRFRQIPIHRHQHFELAQRLRHLAFFPSLHGRLVETRLVFTHPRDFALAPPHFGQQTQRFGLVGLHLHHVVQRFARLPEGLIIQVLPCQRDPFRNLFLAPLPFHLRFQRECVGILRIQFQRLLNLAQRQRIFGGFKKAPRALQHLANARLPHRLVHLSAQQRDFLIQVASSSESTSLAKT